jgi:DNA-binding SARP family transcriptional activator
MANGQSNLVPSDARLTLTTLGRASLSWTPPDGSPTVLLGPGKPLALITYLACAPRRTASRDYVVSLLWADNEPERAVHAMRQTVWQIRHAVGDRVLVTQNGGLTLAANVDTDRDRFLAAVEAGDLEAATERYTGDFLPDFAAPGGAAFEQWADLERVRLRTAFLRCAESLTQRYLTAGRWRDAQRTARRARDTDRLQQGGWRLLLEALEAGNDWTAAAMEADALERLLEVEEREAEPATRAAIRRARKAPEESAGSGRTALAAELVGREKEFAAVLGSWDDAKRGIARHVHVTAPAGLGKTRLLHDVHARLRAAGARTIVARAHPGEREISYAFAAHLAAALATLPGAAGLSPGAASALVSLNPSLSSRYAAEPHPVKSDEALRHRTVALSELLAVVADEGPVAILLDDLHWADAESLQLLGGLAGRVAGFPILLLTAARPVARRIFEGAVTTLGLAPLDEQQVTALVTSIATLPDEQWARDLCARLAWATGGSPLLVLESLQLGLEHGALVLEGSAWASPYPVALAEALSAGSALRRRLEGLDRAAHWIILTLAAAGRPLDGQIIAQAAGRRTEVVHAVLTALEDRGLVTRAGSTWETGHDELTALALDTASPDALRAAREAVGRALAAEAERSPGTARQAARLLADAADRRHLVALFRAWVSSCRARGDHRRPLALAADLMGEAAEKERMRALASTLPWTVRAGFDVPGRRIALAGGAALVLLAAIASWRAGAGAAAPAPEALLYVVEGREGAEATRQVGIAYADWHSDAPLPVGKSVRAPLWSVRFPEKPPAPNPSGTEWVGRVTSSDSGGQDIYLLGADHVFKRLTSTPGDDNAPSWAPDGSRIVYETAEWNRASHYDLAVRDLETGETRQLTRSEAEDQAPQWSPDGTRIAFTRSYFDGRPRALCWIGVNGAALRCTSLPGVSIGSALGWRDERRLVVQADSAGTMAVRVLDVVSGHVTPVPIPETEGISLSPDGNWLLLQGIVPGSPRPAWWVAPLADPAAIRQVTSASGPPRQVLWGAVPRTPRYLDRLAIQPLGLPLPLDGVYHLQAVGRDPAGRAIPVRNLTWRSGDTLAARIDSLGMVHPRSAGTVEVYVSAGGWRSDSTSLTIGAAAYSVVLEESWARPIEEEWVPFGEPRPVTVALSGGGRALWNHGDGSYASGVYTRRAWSAKRALGAQATFRVPLNTIQWQNLAMSLDGSLDSEALARWDHRVGSLEQRRTPPRAECAVLFPDEQGPPASARFAVISMESSRFAAPADMRTGAPHRLRVQILADGRCGVALDGKAVFVSRSSLPLDRPFRLVLRGMSYHTRVLVSDVQLWQGVRGDVDWRQVQPR